MTTDTTETPPAPAAVTPSTPIGRGSWPSADTILAEHRAANYTEQQISDALWLLDHIRHEHVPNYRALVDLLRFDGDASVVSRIMRGVYPGNREPFFQKVRAYRQIVTERLDFGTEPFVETQVWKDVSSLCDLARVSATIAFLFGPNQSGKTRALKRYAELNNHGKTIFVRMPVGGSAKMSLLAIARAAGISERNSYDQLRDRMLRFFDSTMLLIVDEVHQAMIGRSLKVVTIELLRELHDECGVGVVLCGTDVLPQMLDDARFKGFLGQIDNRGVLRRRIAVKPPASDVRRICAAYGLSGPGGEAWELARTIARTSGIGKLTKYLKMARKLAANRHEPLDWPHLLTTHATLTSWAEGHTKEDAE